MKEDERGEKQKPWKKEETLRENQLNSKKKRKKKILWRRRSKVVWKGLLEYVQIKQKRQKLVAIVSWRYITQLHEGLEFFENIHPLNILSFDSFV
jgi:hypothetical protein